MSQATAPQTSLPVALVTGAGRGIGLGTARRFLTEGWRVALLDIDAALLEGAMADLAAPEATLALPCDVAEVASVQTSVRRAAAHFGRLDALVNNAGTAVFKPMLETTPEEWARVMAVNLTGPFVATISGVRASTLRVAYGTSKAALAHLTKQQAVELAALGIRVNAVAPGPVDTAMAKAVHSPEIRKDYHDTIPLNRYGLESELAETIVFLCGPRASYITGQVIAVDGGFEATGSGLPTLRAARRNL